MHEYVQAELKGFSSPRELFNNPGDLNYKEIHNKETDPDGKPRDNGTTTSLLTTPYLLHSPPIDTPEAPDLPLPCPRIDVSSLAFLESEGNLP